MNVIHMLTSTLDDNVEARAKEVSVNAYALGACDEFDYYKRLVDSRSYVV